MDFAQCPKWKLLSTFLRIKPGREIEVAKSLAKQLKKHGAVGALHFKCIGFSDIVELMPTSVLEPDVSHCSHSDILQTTVLPTFSWDNNLTPDRFLKWLERAPCVLLVLAKINPSLLPILFLDGEIRCANYIANTGMNNSTLVFFTFAHSELLIILKGTGLNHLTEQFSILYRNTLVKDILPRSQRDWAPEKIAEEPIFVRSSVFPLVSYEKIILKGKWHTLAGNVNAMTLVSCYPTDEERVANTISANQYKCRQFWGQYDLAIQAEDVRLKDFVPHILKFRDIAGKSTKLYSTFTFLLGNQATGICKSNPAGIDISSYKNNAESRTIESGVKRMVNIVRRIMEADGLKTADEWVKLEIMDFLSKLHDCISDPYVRIDYLDMADFLLWLQTQINSLGDPSISSVERVERQEKCLHASAIATQALYHRSAGIEAHLHGAMYPALLPIIGSNRVARAIADIPCFVVNEIFASKRVGKELKGRKWYGFAAYGPTYEFRHGPGEIITYPVRSLLQPFKEWHVVTHELAHLYCHIAGIRERISELRQSDEYKEKDYEAVNESTVRGSDEFMEELFAHWFDYTYFYERNIDLFLQSIWSTWLETPMVWRDKSQYLLRTLLIWLLHCEQCYRKDHIRSYNKPIAGELAALIQFLSTTCKPFCRFWEGMSAEEKTGCSLNVSGDASWWLFAMHLFETHFWDPNMDARINKTYGNLDKHVKMILSGTVINERIENPKVLFFRLMQSLGYSNHKIRDFSATIALIVTLSNDYHRRVLE